MTETIRLNEETPTDELMTLLEAILAQLINRVGVAMTVATLFGTAVMLTVDDVSGHDR